jgi:flavin reductase (DIM6/NTAB) family NADH-FMN oxidoreductase RutF
VIHAKLIEFGLPKSNVVVWSFSTLNVDFSTNMNIVTYVNQVSIKPHPIWALSLLKGSVTYENFSRERRGVLQKLDVSHVNSIETLGKLSGKNVNKIDILKEKGYRFAKLGIVEVFENCQLLIDLQCSADQQPIDVGDHDIFLCDIKNSFQSFSTDEFNLASSTKSHELTTAYLRNLKLI